MRLITISGLVCLVLVSLMAGSVVGQDVGIIKERPRYGYGPGRPLPPMKLIIRDEATLFAVGEPAQGLIDFSKEMALFVSSDWKAQTHSVITKVTESGGKLNVTLIDGQADQRRSIVVIPKSDAVAEGFAMTVPLVEGLVVESSPIRVEGKVDAKAFEAKAKELGYTVARQDPAGRTSGQTQHVNSLLVYAGPDDAPKAVTFSIGAMKLGRNYGAIANWVGLGKGKESPQQRYPVNLKRVQDALMAAFGADAEKAQKASEKFSRVQGMIMLQEMSSLTVSPSGFEAYIGAEEEMVYRHNPGQLGDYISQRGPNGAILWRKPYVEATKKTDEQGTVVLVLSELGVFQARFEGLKSTEFAELRKTVGGLAEAAGVKLQEKALSEAAFSFTLNESIAPRETVTVETHQE